MSLNHGFKIPIPPSIKKINASQQQRESSYLDTNSASSSWNTFAEPNLTSFNRELRPFLLPQESHSLLNHNLKPSTTMGSYNFSHQGMISSTPLVRASEINRKRNLWGTQPQPPLMATSPMSLPGYGSSRDTESIKSWIHGTSSLRSMNSDSPDFSAVMLRACNLYLERTIIPADLKNKVLEAVNGMRGFVREAVQDLEVDGSLRSHYSKYASSVRSGFSKISDRSNDTMSLLLRSDDVASMSRTQKDINRERCVSMQCSVLRPNMPANSGHQINSIVDTIPRSIPNLKRLRSRGCDSSDDDDDVITPSLTVKKKFNLAAPSDGGCVEIFDSPSEKNTRMRNVPLRRGQKDIKRGKAEANKKSRCIENTTSVSSITLKTNNKQDAVPKTDDAPVAQTYTRSGRNVKKPSFYQIELPKQTTVVVTRQQVRSPIRAVPKAEKVAIRKKETSTNRNKTSLNVELQGKTPIIFHTRSGRAVKMVQNYKDCINISITTGTCKENVAPKQRKKATEKEKNASKKADQKPRQGAIVPNSSAPVNDLFGDISFGGDEIFIPEVTESTRRGVGRAKGLKHLAEQTPPLLHYTSNLNRKNTGGVTPSQTPEWLISQRTQSEVKKLQKRKQAPKKVKPVAKAVVAKKKKNLTKEEKALVDLIRGDRSNIPLTLEVVARPRCSESEVDE